VHGCLSRAADGHTLALITSGAPSPDRGVRLLATAAPGSSLLAGSRLVLPTPTGPENSSGNYWRQVLISADGQVIIAVTQVEAHHASGRMPGVTQKLLTFSATTGTLLRELNHLLVHGGYEHVPWASPSGQLLIVTGTQPGPTVGTFNLGHSAGTLSQGRFTPSPGPPAPSQPPGSTKPSAQPHRTGVYLAPPGHPVAIRLTDRECPPSRYVRIAGSGQRARSAVLCRHATSCACPRRRADRKDLALPDGRPADARRRASRIEGSHRRFSLVVCSGARRTPDRSG